mgnify:CR=1 FL=1
MREQSIRFNSLVAEYNSLKTELFGGCAWFVVDPDNEKHRRYDQLFCWLHPQFRTKEYVDPLNEAV